MSPSAIEIARHSSAWMTNRGCADLRRAYASGAMNADAFIVRHFYQLVMQLRWISAARDKSAEADAIVAGERATNARSRSSIATWVLKFRHAHVVDVSTHSGAGDRFRERVGSGFGPARAKYFRRARIDSPTIVGKTICPKSPVNILSSNGIH